MIWGSRTFRCYHINHTAPIHDTTFVDCAHDSSLNLVMIIEKRCYALCSQCCHLSLFFFVNYGHVSMQNIQIYGEETHSCHSTDTATQCKSSSVVYCKCMADYFFRSSEYCRTFCHALRYVFYAQYICAWSHYKLYPKWTHTENVVH